MRDTAWYLGIRPDQVGDVAIVVGDRGRVQVGADLCENAEIINEDRGLTTAVGFYNGQKITISAFGMGAPIAAVVVHELADLGVKAVVRAGTALTLGNRPLGEFLIGTGAVCREGTSSTYVDQSVPSIASPLWTRALRESCDELGHEWSYGLYASFDGFYTQMTRIETDVDPLRPEIAELADIGVAGVDMETSAVFNVCRALGLEGGSVCLCSVDGTTQERLAGQARVDGERDLMKIALDAASSMAVGLSAKESN